MSDAVGGRGIGCQIGRTSPRSCFTGQGVAQSFFVGNVKRASSSGCCGWCADTFQPELAACSRAAQLVDESLGTLHGGWVQPKKRHHGTDVLWTVYVGLSYKNEITCVIHSIMVLSFFGAIYVGVSIQKMN